MRPSNLRKKILIAITLLALLPVACTNAGNTFEGIEQGRLKLADGSTISQAATDDYSPIIVRLSNNYLALVFGSTRTCSVSCSNHNIFVALSTAAYADSGFLPAFFPPQPLAMYGTSGLNYAARIRLAVLVSGTTIKVFAQYSGSTIQQSNYFSPSPSSPIDVGTSLMGISDTSCSNQRLLGADASGRLLAHNAAATQVYRFDPVITSGQCMSANVANPKLSTGTHISLMRQTSTGIADGYIVSDTAGKVSAQSVTSSGPQLQVLIDGLASSGLVSTGVSVMQGTSEEGDLITFSAAPSVGGLSDLYVLLSPKPAALWKQYVAAGAQPSP